MAQYFTFFSVILFIAIFKPHNINATSNTSDALTENSAKADDSDWGEGNLDTSNIITNCIKEDGTTYCTEMKNYPEEIDNLIADKYLKFKTFFADDTDKPDNVTEQRVAKDPKQIVCSSTKRRIYPKSAQDKDLNWSIIVNTEFFRQGIEIEECDNEGEKCGGINGIKVPSPYKVVCKQDYNYRSLIAYINKTFIRQIFRIPSCCKCVLINEENLYTEHF